MRAWTKPILIKDTMVLSQYSVSTCDSWTMTLSCTASGNGLNGHLDDEHPIQGNPYVYTKTISDDDHSIYENYSPSRLLGLLDAWDNKHTPDNKKTHLTHTVTASYTRLHSQ